MHSKTVGELKADFSEVLRQVQRGEEYEILFGRAKKPVARIVPFEPKPSVRKIGIWEGKYKLPPEKLFKFASTEEFLGDSGGKS